jgi:hypothetical protein
MGEVGTKLTELNVTGDERQKAYTKLAENPSLTPKVSDLLKTLPPGDKTSAQKLLGAAQDAMSGRATPEAIEYKLINLQPQEAGEQTQEEEPKTLLQLLQEILGAIISAPIKAASQSLDDSKQQGKG